MAEAEETPVMKCASCQNQEPASWAVRAANATCRRNDVQNHKPNCKRENFILKIDLEPQGIKKPRISRTLSCPASATFADLHNAIQISFGWQHAHLYHFHIRKKMRPGDGSRPFKMPLILTDFTLTPRFDDEYGDGPKDDTTYRLHNIFDDRDLNDKAITYQYDFGDCWQHVIKCTKRVEPTEHFVCLRGSGHPAGEDVGGCGRGGWFCWKHMMRKTTEEQEERRKWYKECIGDDEGVGLRDDVRFKWDEEEVNRELTE